MSFSSISNIKTNEIEVISDLGLALTIGAMAAIAVAPHIAVPLDMRIIWLRFKLKNLPIMNPNNKIKRTNIEMKGIKVFVNSYAS